jgi:hypothetical protein
MNRRVYGKAIKLWASNEQTLKAETSFVFECVLKSLKESPFQLEVKLFFLNKVVAKL